MSSTMPGRRLGKWEDLFVPAMKEHSAEGISLASTMLRAHDARLEHRISEGMDSFKFAYAVLAAVELLNKPFPLDLIHYAHVEELRGVPLRGAHLFQDALHSFKVCAG
jgi:hypothetical protein